MQKSITFTTLFGRKDVPARSSDENPRPNRHQFDEKVAENGRKVTKSVPKVDFLCKRVLRWLLAPFEPVRTAKAMFSVISDTFMTLFLRQNPVKIE